MWSRAGASGRAAPACRVRRLSSGRFRRRSLFGTWGVMQRKFCGGEGQHRPPAACLPTLHLPATCMFVYVVCGAFSGRRCQPPCPSLSAPWGLPLLLLPLPQRNQTTTTMATASSAATPAQNAWRTATRLSMRCIAVDELSNSASTSLCFLAARSNNLRCPFSALRMAVPTVTDSASCRASRQAWTIGGL